MCKSSTKSNLRFKCFGYMFDTVYYIQIIWSEFGLDLGLVSEVIRLFTFWCSPLRQHKNLQLP